MLPPGVLNLVLLAHVAATLYMTGVIWLVQVVHYPLFSRVGEDKFTAYESAHTALITFVVMPPMLIEAGTALLFILIRPAGIPAWQAWVGLILVGIIWGSTFLLQVPQHTTLGGGFDAQAHNFLVASNWVRTVAWSLRSLLVLWMVGLLISR